MSRDLILSDLKRAQAVLGHFRDQMTEHGLAVEARESEAPPTWLVRAEQREASLTAWLAAHNEGDYGYNDTLAALLQVQAKLKAHRDARKGNFPGCLPGMKTKETALTAEQRKLVRDEAAARRRVAQLTEELSALDARDESQMHERAIQGEEEAERIAWENERRRRERAEFEAWRAQRRAKQN